MIVKASDGLVSALYQRIRADRAGESILPRDGATWSWRELADRAVAEGVLTAREVRLLRAMVSWPDASVPATHASGRRAAARPGEAA